MSSTRRPYRLVPLPVRLVILAVAGVLSLSVLIFWSTGVNLVRVVVRAEFQDETPAKKPPPRDGSGVIMIQVEPATPQTPPAKPTGR